MSDAPMTNPYSGDALGPDPETPDEWRVAVDLAYGALAVEYARQCGFLTGGPAFNVARCVRLVSEGKRRGYRPSELDGIRAVLAEGESDPVDPAILRVVVKLAASAGEHLADLVQSPDVGAAGPNTERKQPRRPNPTNGRRP